MSTPRKPVTLGEAVDAYLASIAVPGTVRAYGQQCLTPMAEHFGRDMLLAGLEPDDIADWLEDKWGHASAGTWNMRSAAVRSAYRWWAKRKKWVTPVLLAEMLDAIEPKRSRTARPSEILTPAEVAAILAQTRVGLQPSTRYPTVIRNRAMIMLLYRSGLRVTEMLSVRPCDIDMASRSIRVLATKSGHPQTRYFHESATESLTRWLDRRAELGINGRNPVFCTLKGGPLADYYVRTMLREHAASAGIEKRVHPHGLRHTFAVELEASGVSVSEISKLLGHSGVGVTAGYLDHLTNSGAGKALAAADLPDVGEGSGGQAEPDLAAEMAALRERLTALEDRQD